MSTPQQSKQLAQERSSRARDKLITFSDENRRRTPSKTSVLGPAGSRISFHRRDKFKVPKYQNTYRLESFRPFYVEAVDKIVRESLEKTLSPIISYQPSQSTKLCSEIATTVQKSIVRKDYDRYKIVVQVSIVQRMDQAMNAAFQCLWDSVRDNYSYYVFESNCIYAWCCVFGVYYE